jgi:hypothetical protein
MLCFFIVVIGFFVIYVLNCPPSSYGYRREDISEPEYEYEYGDDDYDDEEDDEDYEYDDDIIDDGDYPDYDVYQEGSQRETDYWYYYNTDEEE